MLYTQGKTLKKPRKKSDQELMSLIAEKMTKGDYVFLKHAEQRQKDRDITDYEVLDILEGKTGRKRKRNKIKDKYEQHYQDWNYCIEGMNLNGIKIRIILSFRDTNMLIITVIRLTHLRGAKT